MPTFLRVLDLMSYLRAHCLLIYNGPDFQKIKVTEPTVLAFEILVLEQYLNCVKLILESKRQKGLKDVYDE